MTETKQENIINNHFLLYSTEACHLCNEAMHLLNDLHQQMLLLAKKQGYPVSQAGIFSIKLLDIANDEALVEAYGKRIPVLIFSPTAEELAWPFDIQEAYQFILPKLILR